VTVKGRITLVDDARLGISSQILQAGMALA
jgi:hypothetical protein